MIGYIYNATILSACKMFRKNPDLKKFTSQTGDREPNHSFHFGTELKKYFPWLSCDFDVTKRDHGDQRPDLIIHKRGGNHYNLLVVEVKRKCNANVNDWCCMADEQKIRRDWFSGRLLYPYGISFILDETTTEFAFNFLINGCNQPLRREPSTCDSAYYPSLESRDLMKRIAETKLHHRDADTSTLERELDSIIFDELGLTTSERDAVYEAVIDLVSKRLMRAQTITS